MSSGYRTQTCLLLALSFSLVAGQTPEAFAKKSLAEQLSTFGKSLLGQKDKGAQGNRSNNSRYGRSKQNKSGPAGVFGRSGNSSRSGSDMGDDFDYEKEFFQEEPKPRSASPLQKPITKPKAVTSDKNAIRPSPVANRSEDYENAMAALAEEASEPIERPTTAGGGLSAFLESGRAELPEPTAPEDNPFGGAEPITGRRPEATEAVAEKLDPPPAIEERGPVDEAPPSANVGESLRQLRPGSLAQAKPAPRREVVVKPEPIVAVDRTPVARPVTSSTDAEQRLRDAFHGTRRPSKQQASNPVRTRTDSPQERPANNGAVLVQHEQPTIESRLEGPGSIVVGKEAGYRVVLGNRGQTAVKELVAKVEVPGNAELIDTFSTSGVVKRSALGDANSIDWRIYDLQPHAEHVLSLRLVPQDGSRIPLTVEWSQAPTGAVANIDVMEPKLKIAIEGPSEVLYGEPQRYKLVLNNPGSGSAENVVVELLPPGQEAGEPTSHSVGVLKAGERREVELELTARDEGELLMHASAHADTGLFARAEKEVLCRRPAIEVDWRGPDKKYAGTVASYYFRVRNPGSAATEQVEVVLDLPEEAEFVTASEGHQYRKGSGRVIWELPSLDEGEEQFLQVRCKLQRPGTNILKFSANAQGGLSDSAESVTDVVALADLKLEVSDPQGPIAVGDDTVYEVRVLNRGTTAARGVNVIGLFSEGIDPTSVEGAQYRVQDGRVSFQPIDTLPAGGSVTLRIHAEAKEAGTHVFRAEVVCQDLELKLATEETTRFYQDDFRWEPGETPYTAEREDDGTLR